MKKQLSLIMLIILLISMMSFLGNNILHVQANTTYYVGNSGSDANPGTQTSPWQHIQYAVTHAHAGDTIIVEAGTYDEQVVINQALTLEGVGDATIIKPGASTLSQVYTIDGGDWDGWNLASIIIVEDVSSGSVTIENLRVDGINVNVPVGYSDCYPVGITYGESSGTIQNVTIVNMNTTTYVDRSYGIWLNAFSTAVSDTIQGCTVLGYYRNGIMTTGDMLTFDINGNTVTGPGTIGPVQLSNGICIADGSGGNVSDNMVTNNLYNNLGDIIDYPWLSMGIIGWDEAPGTTISGNVLHNNDEGIAPTTGDLIYNNQIFDNMWGIELEEGAANNTIQFNNITDNTVGIHLLGPGDPWYTELSDEPGTGNLAALNNIYGNTVGVQNWDTNQTFSAQRNWWGSATGPGPVGPGVGEKISSNVDYTAWLAKPYTTTETYADYKSAIVEAADRLVALQSSTDYGWDWVVTGLTSHSASPSATNLYGVTALGLLDAYVETDDPTYLNAANYTANFMMYGDASNGDFYNGHGSYYWGFSFDYKFLVEFSTLWGDSSYNNYALAAWAWEKANLTKYADGNQNMIWNELVNQWVGTGYYGIGAWQASDYGLAAWEMGDTVWAQQMANVINANISNIALPFTPPYIATNYTNDDVNLGMAWALKLLITVNPVAYASSITKLENQLLSNQLIDGSWGFNSTTSPGDTQTTAYVVMALWAAGEYSAAQRGAEWLLSTQLPNGGWFESPDEYSEIDSEALQALVTAIPTPSYTITDYENAIASSANRLVALQSPKDYGWDWYVTGLTSHSASPSPSNLYGVTAIGLIDAYDKTGNLTYLTAAENTADFMMYGDPSNGDFFNGYGSYTWGRSSDYTFLIDLSAVTDNPVYKNYALAAWAWQKANATDARLGGSGQLAWADGNQSILFYDLVNYWVGPGYYGLASWQASDWGLAALAMGDTSWAMGMAAVINANVANIALPYTAPYIATNYTNDYVNLGIAWALELLVTVNPVTYASSITKLENQLLSNQLSDGSWSNWFLDTPPGESQTTAYAVMALITAHEYAAARKGADWLMSTQFTDGGWSSCPSEYSESDSEDMQALASSIPQLTVVSAYGSPVPNGTTIYFAGTSITANVTSPVSGPAGTRYVCTGWSGTGSVPSSGTGTSVTFNITQDSSITWNWKTQCSVTFDATGIGKDFTGTVVTIDGTNYGLTSLPVPFWYDNGSSHSFSFASQLIVNVNKVYVWNFTSDLTTLESGTLKVNASGFVVGNYILKNAITFDTVGVYSDFTGTVITIDGTPYNFSSLPLSFNWTVGSTHSFAFQSALLVAANTKQYAWASTTGSLTSAQSGYITVTTYGIIVGNYKTQYYLTLTTSPPGINAPTGAGWCDSGTYAAISTAQYVPAPGSSRYRFNGWTTADMMEITNPSSNSTTVLVNEAKTVTANYVQIYSVAVTNIVPLHTAVYRGCTLPINVTVENEGDFPENVTVTLEGSYFALGTQTINNLQPGTSYTLVFIWNTTTFAEKDYRLQANITIVPGPNINATNNIFTDGWIRVTRMGDLGGYPAGSVVPQFGYFTGTCSVCDIPLFIQCYRHTAPPQWEYLGDLGGYPPHSDVPQFFLFTGSCGPCDIPLFIRCYRGTGPA